MLKESSLRRRVKRLIKDAKDTYNSDVHVSWVESHDTSIGIPDLNYCSGRVEGWLELKAGPDIEVRASQVRWMKDRIKAGGHPLFLIEWGNMFLIIPGSAASDLRLNPCLENALRLASSVWHDELPTVGLLRAMRAPKKEYGRIHIDEYA